MTQILIYSLVAGLATTFGASLVLYFRAIGERSFSVLLGGAAGVMVTIVAMDLFPSAWYEGGPLLALEGTVAGLILLTFLDLILSQGFSPSLAYRDRLLYLRKTGYLIATGIALHDLPEGIAIAAGYASTLNLGPLLALAIGLHNIPEGLATAAPLRMGGLSRRRIMLLILGVSLFTPIGTLIGLALVAVSPHHIATLLALAAGAMLYIVFHELLPEARRRHPNYALLGAFLGIILTAFLSH